MMRKQRWNPRTKGILLSILILSAVVQTAMLWLGDMPGHNLFGRENIVSMEPVEPESIWVNRGDPFTFAYRVDNSKVEYKRLVEQLVDIVEVSLQNISKTSQKALEWDELLSLQGILYQYSIPVDLEEVTGNKENTGGEIYVNSIFINIVDGSGSIINIYFIDESNESVYYQQVKGDFSNIVKLYNTLNVGDDVEGLIRYQPSTKENIGYLIEGNAFLPLFNASNPMTYDVLRVYNPIKNEEDAYGIIESYVNPFFERPLLKKVELRADGSYVFTEPMKTIVRYKPNGVLEYNNLDVETTDMSMGMLEGYNVAMRFIEETKSIPQTIKDKIYLARVSQSQRGKDYTFYFNMMYNGHPVNFSDEFKQELGLSYLIEVTVRNEDIVSAKWTILEIAPTYVKGEAIQNTITTQYTVPINAVYEEIKHIEASSLIQDVKLVYKVENSTKDIELKWGVRYDNKWYYPE